MVFAIKERLKSVDTLVSLIRSSRAVKKKFITLFLIKRAAYYQKQEVEKLKNKIAKSEKIKVAFLLMDLPLWKTDTLYKLLKSSPYYEPVIVPVPRINGHDPKGSHNRLYNYFKDKGYNVAQVYNEDRQNWEEVNALIQPDIVFFTNPHNLTYPKYYIRYFYKKLTCYVPYFEQICTNYADHFDNDTLNLCWKVFQINHVHKQISVEHSIGSGRNVEVVGYPAMEPFYNENYNAAHVWRDNKNKKIIIAPHHSIENSTTLSNSTFIDTAACLKKFAEDFKDTVDFAFKPHPLLKQKLYEHADWGRTKTDNYWNFWSASENTQLEEGEYIDLFIGSDALIHDCSSFLIEYLYLKKPALYLNDDIRSGLNLYGQMGYDAIRKAHSSADIFDFINTVIKGEAQNYFDVASKIIPNELPSLAIIKSLNSVLICDNQ